MEPLQLKELNTRIKELELLQTHTPEQWKLLKELHTKRIGIKKMLKLVMPPDEEDEGDSRWSQYFPTK